MKAIAVILGVLFSALLSGCSYKTEVGGVERTDLSDVDPLRTQQQIEEALGAPVGGEELDLGELYIYAYDTGRTGSSVRLSQGLGGFNPAVYLIFPIVAAAKSAEAPPRVEQRGHLAVLYNSDNEAEWVWVGGRIDADEALRASQTALAELLEKETIACVSPDGSLSMVAPLQCLEGEGAAATGGRSRVYELRARAHDGDPEAMYQYAKTLKYSEARIWYCRAAHLGVSDAQEMMGKYYHFGIANGAKDLVRANLWYSLAGSIALNVSAMSPGQIEEYEQLLADWEPSPLECDLEATKLEH